MSSPSFNHTKRFIAIDWPDLSWPSYSIAQTIRGKAIKLFNNVSLTDAGQCAYLSHRKMQYAQFFASDLDERELDDLLNSGWRKFGYCFFKPVCGNCKECIPLRIPVVQFTPGKSHRRLLNKNSDITVSFEQEIKDPELLYSIYEEHSLARFGKSVNREDFEFSFCTRSCPGMYSHYYLGEELIAAGFIDSSTDALSSVYFIYRSAFTRRAMGNFSILKEIQYTRELGKKYYYLGYYVENCSRMIYKSRFYPHELYDWQKGIWTADGQREVI